MLECSGTYPDSQFAELWFAHQPQAGCCKGDIHLNFKTETIDPVLSFRIDIIVSVSHIVLVKCHSLYQCSVVHCIIVS